MRHATRYFLYHALFLIYCQPCATIPVYMIAILHNIRSAHNVGSMFRTADAAGLERLYLCGITPTPVKPEGHGAAGSNDMLGSARKAFEKTALGAEKSVPWEKCARTADCIRKLKAVGYFVCAVELAPDAVPYHEADFLKKNTDKLAFVVGHETDGLPKALLHKCDAIIRIPMYGKKESLNVAVAFGIIAFEIARNTIR